jgi:dolichol-phosphate mannosyltransferase
LEQLVREGWLAFSEAVDVDDGPLEFAVIVPTFNEAANVEPLLQKLSLALAGIRWEVVFVDDNSPDGTSSVVRQIALENRQVRIVQRIGRRGLTSAVIEGMLASAAPVLAVIDGDLQHDEMILPRMYKAISKGEADIAVGTRYVDGGGVSDWDEKRVLASRVANWIGNRAIKVELSDPMSGLMAISRTTLMDAMPRLSGMGFKVLLDIIASLPAKPKVVEIPYVFKSRVAGESKIGAVVLADYAALLLDKTIGRYVPLRLLSFLAVGGMGVGVHLTLLGLSLAMGLAFLPAEIVAVSGAILFNFTLNNIFTYRDRRLRGFKMVTGFLSFCAVCSVGAVANIGIGTWVSGTDTKWWLAGLAGTVIGAIWNFSASSFLTWRKA